MPRFLIKFFLSSCRNTQQEFDTCMKEKMNLERPEIGWLSKVRLFESSRPKPVEKPVEYEKLPSPPPNSDLKNHPEAIDSLKKTERRFI